MADRLRGWTIRWLPPLLQWTRLDKFFEQLLSTAKDQEAALTLFRQIRTALPCEAAGAALLHPASGVVAFDRTNRGEDLRRLKDWCHDRALGPVAWRLLTGPSGCGKTRLLLQLIEDLQEPGGHPWDAGFVDMPRLREANEAERWLAALRGDLLLVVDYAERYRDDVVELGLVARELARRHPERRVRLLLISRRDSDVWRSIADDDVAVGTFIRAGGLSRQELLPLAPSVEARETAFRAAYADFAKMVDGASAIDDIDLPDLSPEDFGDAFTLHAAALFLAGGGTTRDTLTRESVLAAILDRERLVWNQSVRDRTDLPTELRDEPIRRAAAWLTLICVNEGIAHSDRAVALLRLCPGLGGQDDATLARVANLFHELYPGPGWVNGVTPDPIGTYLLRHADDQLIEHFLCTELNDREATNGLTKLNWLAQEWPDVGRRKLMTAFAANPARVIPLAMQVALESGDPIGTLAAEYLQAHPNVDLAREIEASVPQVTTALRELAAVAAEILHTDAGIAGVDDFARRAAAANDLSIRLGALGRREEALAAIEEAVAILRELAAARPDAFRPTLAASLTNLSADLRALGRREEALAAIEEAVAIRRELTAARPDDFRPNLAVSLNNLSVDLSALGRREEALAAIEEAVAIRRELTAARPDAFRPDLAASLINLSAHLGALGRREEALAVIEEAVTIHRELTAARPDAFRPDLAASLTNLSAHLGDLGRREEALAAIEEAVTIRRELAAARPDAFRPDLAQSLNNLSVDLRALGRREEALAAIEEAVTIRRELAAARPDAFRPDLAASLTNLSAHLGDLGRREEALAAIEEAVTIRRELAAARPDAFRPDLAASLTNLSNRLSALGRREEALAAIEEAVAIRRELAAARPDAFRPDLASSLYNMALGLDGMVRRAEAALAAREAANLYGRLAGDYPDVFGDDLADAEGLLTRLTDEAGEG